MVAPTKASAMTAAILRPLRTRRLDALPGSVELRISRPLITPQTTVQGVVLTPRLVSPHDNNSLLTVSAMPRRGFTPSVHVH